MKINKIRPTSAWVPFFILFSAVFCLHSDTVNRSLFSRYSGFSAADHSLDVGYLWGNEKAPCRVARSRPGLEGTSLAILGGVVGNFVGIFSGLYIANLASDGGESFDPIVGGVAGSVCGSTLGAYLAGRAGGCKGKFASALLGSLLGEAAAVALACAIPGEEFPLLTGFFFLPPIGAAMVFNGSRRYRSSRMGSGIFNLSEGKLGLGVPDVHVRPVMVPDGRAKTEMQFNVRVLSVEI